MLSLIHSIAGRPWAIRAELAAHVRGLIVKEGIAGLRHLAELKATIHAFDEDGRPQAARGRAAQPVGTVAVVPVVGTMTQRGDYINSAETRSTAGIAEEVLAAAAEPKVDAILLEIDSPGGEVFGVPEAWAAVREARKAKPVVAIANSIAASAAYYLFSAADEGWVTPSGMVGSIGVYALHVDLSKWLEDEGEKWTFIVSEASPFKVEGNELEPLTDEARDALQKDVDRYMGMFLRDVAKGRGVSTKVVTSRFGGGRMLGAEDAVAAKMADRVGTLDAAIYRAAELGRERRRESGARAEAVVTSRPAASIGEAPNLREGSAERACVNCNYYRKPSPAIPSGACSRYDFTTQDLWLCDGWEAKAAETAGVAVEEESPTAEQRAAIARLRTL